MNHFFRFLDEIEKYSGLKFPETHHPYLIDAIKEFCDSDDPDYLDFRTLISKEDQKRQKFFNRITINETYFFREEKQFKVLKTLLSNFRSKHLNLWSVTCSTGEEAISLALIGKDAVEKGLISDFHVYAYDINEESLEHLKEGRFESNSFRSDGSGFHYLLNPYLNSIDSKICTIDIDLLKKISTHRLNLFEESLDVIPTEGIHIAFFRNTLVYMQEKRKQELIKKIIPLIHKGGFLFLSSTEIPFIHNDDLEIQEIQNVYFFQRRELGNIHSDRYSTQETKGSISEIEREADLRTKTSEQRISPSKFEVQTKEGKETIETGILDLLLRIQRDLSSNQFGEAEAGIRDVRNLSWNHEILEFFQGLLFFHQKRFSMTIQFFQKSLELNSGFWPARFYLALSLKETSPQKAIPELKIVLQNLENNGSNLSFPPGLLDEMDVKYYRILASNWIARLSLLTGEDMNA